MDGAYIDKQYAYQVARIRGAELSLLTTPFLLELIQKEKVSDILNALREKGFGKEGDETADQILETESLKTWQFVDELVPERSFFDVFRLDHEYHNLKAAIKEAGMKYPYPGIYFKDTLIPAEELQNAIAERKFDLLPYPYSEVAKETLDVYLRTSDGQLLDSLVDRACLQAILKAGKESDSEFIREYAEMKVASTDIRIAVRSAKTRKDKAFYESALAECATLDINALTNAGLNGGVEGICAYLLTTDYRDAAPELKTSETAFENYCDNVIMRRMQKELYESFGIGPIAAYILARESELKSVRMIIAAKQNGFSEEVMKERLRETYV